MVIRGGNKDLLVKTLRVKSEEKMLRPYLTTDGIRFPGRRFSFFNIAYVVSFFRPLARRRLRRFRPETVLIREKKP